MKTRHAVISNNYIAWLDGDQLAWHMCPIAAAADAWEAATYAVGGFTHMWVMPGDYTDKLGRDFCKVSAGLSGFFHYDEATDLPTFGRVNEGRDTATVLLGWPRAFGWNVKTPGDLLETIQYLEMQYGVPVQWGNGHMGRAILAREWHKTPDVLRGASYDLRDLPFSEAAKDILFRRVLFPNMVGWHVHHFDKNSSYLAADSSVYIGIGEPEHLEGGNITAGLPGIYRVRWSMSGGTDFDGETLPTIIEEGQEWVTNDVLAFAMQHGYSIKIVEAWVFKEYKRVLAPMAKAIWTGRQNFKGDNPFYPNDTARRNAYNTSKQIALTVNGGWNMRKAIHPKHEGIFPQRWADTVGKARVNMLANVLKYSAVAGAPICIEADGLYFLSRDENYRTAVPGILDRMNELGGYKHCGTCTITRDMYRQAESMNAGQLADMFKVAGGEKE